MIQCSFAIAEVAIDWEIKKLEEKFRGEIETGVREYLGPQQKFKVYVQIVGKKKTEEKKAINFNDKEFGYLSVADSYQNIRVYEKIFVKNISIDVFVYDSVEKGVENNIRKIASGAVKGFQSKVTISIMPSPIAKVEPANIADFDIKKFLLEHASDIFKLFSSVFLGGVLLFGLYLLAKALVTAFKTMGDAVKSSTDKYTHQQQINQELTKEEKNKEDEKIAQQKNEEAFNNQLALQFERNIDIVKSCIKISPHVFKQVLIRKDENLRGLKSLLPLIVELTDKLKESISVDVWKKLEEIDGINEGVFNRWLNTFSEDLSVAQMTENGYFSHAVDHVLLERVYAAKFSHLVDAAIKINTSILYKFIFDFLPSEESVSLMECFSEETWKIVLTERNVNANDLNNDIKEMLKVVDGFVEKEKYEINDQGMSRILSSPISFFIESKSFEESEEFFNIISTSAPDVANLFRSKFWTPQMFFRIPEDYLMEKFSTMKMELRGQVLLGISSDVRLYLLSLIPEGRVMTIMTEQYNNNLENLNQKMKEDSFVAAKEFLKALKVDHGAGKYALKEESDVVANNVVSIKPLLHIEEREEEESNEGEELKDEIGMSYQDISEVKDENEDNENDDKDEGNKAA